MIEQIYRPKFRTRKVPASSSRPTRILFGMAHAAVRESVLRTMQTPLDGANMALLENDQFCSRFLAEYKELSTASRAISDALTWRAARRPIGPICCALPEEIELLRRACRTGAVTCPGLDRRGRAIVVLDNSVAPPGEDFDAQVKQVAFVLEFALRHMRPPHDRIVLVCKLGSFSSGNSPSLSETREMVSAFA